MTRVVHCKKEPYDVYIGRPSKWGNPFTHLSRADTLAEHHVASRQEAVEKYREWIAANHELLSQLEELRGKTLGCWCSPKPCHGDVLVELVNNK